MEEEVLLLNEPTIGGGGGVFNFDLSFLQSFVIQVGDNPILAMYGLIIKGGWIVLLLLLLLALRALWLNWRQSKFMAARTYVLLAIDVPKESEQTVKAVENMFAHLAGAHSPATFMEKWIEGKVQIPISFEIISIEGHIQYLVRCLAALRDLVEASIYAQYPTAEITQVEDYTGNIPSHYPNDEYDLFGTEMIPVMKNDVYPLKTYVDFEHMLTSEFKDPLAAMLEAFSRLGSGEQVWYQLIATPIAQVEFKEQAKKEIMKLTGQKAPVKKNIAEKALDVPISLMGAAADVAFGTALGAPQEKKKDELLTSRVFNMTPGERKVVESIERKMSKIQYKCKIRIIYAAKKESYNKQKIIYSFIGAIKQYNTNDMQSLKPDSKTGVNSTLLLFKKRRNDARKDRLLSGYRRRSHWTGKAHFHLGTDELASLWHLPVVKDVKAPQLKKTESKKIEPPLNIPFA